jgi:MEMO1 family protein
MTVRQPAVAGLFYPGSGPELHRVVTALLQSCGGFEAPKIVLDPPFALIVPHAGYIYSGPVAARAYRLLAPVRARVSRVLLLGPAHFVPIRGMAVPRAAAFLTPLGEVPVDRQAVSVASRLPGVIVSDRPHAEEHSLEVQLPFLQAVLGEFKLLPVVAGDCDPEQVAALIDAFWAAGTVVVVSSDLSHFLSYENARELDQGTCKQILARQAGLRPEQACGATAINGLLRSRHARERMFELLDLRNSGDTAGDRQRVVGYAAFVLH